MSDAAEEQDIQFFQLIISLHAGTMQQLGKVANPFTGEIDRNIAAAKNSIDLLEMLQRKMKGNLSEQETKMFETTLFELRMNYVDEVKKDNQESGKAAESTETDEPDNGTSEQTENSSESESSTKSAD